MKFQDLFSLKKKKKKCRLLQLLTSHGKRVTVVRAIAVCLYFDAGSIITVFALITTLCTEVFQNY